MWGDKFSNMCRKEPEDDAFSEKFNSSILSDRRHFITSLSQHRRQFSNITGNNSSLFNGEALAWQNSAP